MKVDVNIFKLLNTFIIKILDLDPNKESLIKNLNNQDFFIKITDLNLCFGFVPTADTNLKISNKTSQDTKNILQGKSEFILELLLEKNIQELITNDNLHYEGSLNALKNYNVFFESIRPDLILKISEKTNSDFAAGIENIITGIKNFIKKSIKNNKQDVYEFIIEEQQITPSQAEVNDFFENIQTLKQDLDRVSAKANIIIRKIK